MCTLLCLINNRGFEELNSGNTKPMKSKKYNFKNIAPKIVEEDEDYEDDYEKTYI